MRESQGMSNKIQLGLSAVMFFAPLVQNILRSPTLELSEEDTLFVQWYVRYGYVTIVMLLLSIWGTIAYYFSPIELLYWIHTFCIFVLFILLVAGTIGVVANFHVLQFGSTHQIHPQRVQEQSSTIIPAFAPLYNIYLRYKLHTFDTPFWWAKESILWWWCFTLISIIFASPLLSSFIFIVMVLRLATLTYGMDYFSASMRQELQNLFRVNPEEIRAYILAAINRAYALINKNTVQETYTELVEKHKATYMKLVTIQQQKEYSVRAEWIVGLLIGTLIVYSTIVSGWLWLGVLVGVLLVWRYGVMAYFWKHIPHLPLAKEIVDASIWIAANKKNILNTLYHFIRPSKWWNWNV